MLCAIYYNYSPLIERLKLGAPNIPNEIRKKLQNWEANLCSLVLDLGNRILFSELPRRCEEYNSKEAGKIGSYTQMRDEAFCMRMYVCAQAGALQWGPADAGGRSWTPWNWSYKWLQNAQR